MNTHHQSYFHLLHFAHMEDDDQARSCTCHAASFVNTTEIEVSVFILAFSVLR
jgi:hypothetical protein